ncbi:hypothetical protein CLIB1423_03S07228 [[Candida] railenensis]|uniref:Uncharacterized protein n=1 Tax=[Candida] railenensis TaxID=45579 RepID=A0A9P0QN68_9ASCO|nr:hypothetical protein CLIB1423_03S07228 [[Candida] railenensis]
MAGTLRFTAAKTSIINKKSGSSSVNPLKRLLPSQSKYQQNLKSRSQKIDTPSQNTKKEEPLTILDYNVQLDYQLSQREDLMTAIDTILDNQWSESSSLQDRYHSAATKSANTPQELLFSLSGLSMQTKAEIMKYRVDQLPHGLVTVNQIYSIYEKLGHTFVDRSLELRIREGKLKKFIITNASPIISRSPQKFQSGKVTYGFENVEIVVKLDNYLNHVQGSIAKASEDEEVSKCLEKFASFVRENPTALYISSNLNKEENFTPENIATLVDFGYVTLTSNHLNEIESHQYAVSYPNCGTYLKLINACRTWLVKFLSKSKFKEVLETQMYDRWEGITQQTNSNAGSQFASSSKMTNFRKPYYGFELNWVLADALGAGVVEVFSTPVGRGWRLTGKM